MMLQSAFGRAYENLLLSGNSFSTSRGHAGAVTSSVTRWLRVFACHIWGCVPVAQKDTATQWAFIFS